MERQHRNRLRKREAVAARTERHDLPTGEWICSCGETVNGIRLVCQRCGTHKADLAQADPRPIPMSRGHDILVGDLITVAGVFRDGTMDEHRQHIADNVQVWRVAEHGGARLLPVLPSGAPDVHSYWYGRSTGIVTEYGSPGLVSSPSRGVNGTVSTLTILRGRSPRHV